MKFKATVAVLGTATLLQLVIGTAALANPAADAPQKATEQTLTQAVQRLRGVYANRQTAEQAPAATAPSPAPAAPSQPAQVPTPAAAPAPAPAAKADDEGVVLMDLTHRIKSQVSPALRKRYQSLKKSAPEPVLQKVSYRQRILARRSAEIASAALSYRGTPYVWGGSSPRAFDCSGFTQYLYKRQYGISLPHNARMQYSAGRSVDLDSIKSGDLVFFNTRGPLTHVGMYLGGGKFIHAANPRKGVRVDALAGYYMNVFAGARSYR